MDQAYFYHIWQKLAFQIVHKVSIWALLAFFATAVVSWHLANLLDKHNDRNREAKMARKTAVGYTAAAFALWLFSAIMS